jgi:NADPH:quinone reductase
MKAALCRTLDGPGAISIEDIPAPEPAPGEVAVRVRAAGLNFMDTLITRGRYQYKPSLPFSPAAEIAGDVQAVGPGVTGFRAGDRVCAYVGWGGAREITVAKAAALVGIPDAVDYATAAGLNVTYGTAMHGLIDRARLKAGETVAVLGASGGAGLAAVEVARQLGARVIAVASSGEKLAVCRQHGAHDVLNYTEQDLKQGLRDLTAGCGADVVYDCVGGVHAEQALRSIAWLGRFLVVGFAAGEIPRIPLNLVLLKCCDIVGVFWSEVAVREPEKQAANIACVMDWISKARLRPHVHARMPLEDIGKAIKLLDERTVRGKVIIEIS